jgi:hypothetical protein
LLNDILRVASNTRDAKKQHRFIGFKIMGKRGKGTRSGDAALLRQGKAKSSRSKAVDYFNDEIDEFVTVFPIDCCLISVL